MQLEIRSLEKGEAATCEDILRALPEWFGIEESIVEYRRDVESMETWVARGDGAIAGFITLREHNPYSAEIQVLAVRAEQHGSGVGTQLVAHAEELLTRRAIEYLQVKTLGPSRPCPFYERTRRFYERCGFRPLEENALWGDVNPCLILVKRLG